jgi:hypothetical protein
VDDTLQLYFLCAHPSLTPSSAVALTLRAVGGLTTRQIAQAYLVPEATMAQRISRAKRTVSGVRFDQPGDVATVYPAPPITTRRESSRSPHRHDGRSKLTTHLRECPAVAPGAVVKLRMTGSAGRTLRALKGYGPVHSSASALVAVVCP